MPNTTTTVAVGIAVSLVLSKILDNNWPETILSAVLTCALILGFYLLKAAEDER